jgi:hypothetical protein
MISRRQFAKTLGGAVTLTAIKPDALWSGEPTARTTPTAVSPVAAQLYRKVLVIDGDVLGEIGFPISTDDPYHSNRRSKSDGYAVWDSSRDGVIGRSAKSLPIYLEKSRGIILQTMPLCAKSSPSFCSNPYEKISTQTFALPSPTGCLRFAPVVLRARSD